MKKMLFILVMVLVLLCTMIGGAGAEWWEEYQNTTESTTVKTFTERPGIKGSSAYDITVSLKTMGAEVGKRQSDDYGYIWQASYSDSMTDCYAYITTNKSYEISYATFDMTGRNNGFLYWAATLPYDGKKDDSAAEWVEKNQNTTEEISLQVGDIIYKLIPSKTGLIMTLDIEHIEYPDYAFFRVMNP